MKRVLIAGVGNIFLGDDGFGVEVARRPGTRTLPEGVRVEDYGIRAVHLAYELLSGYDGLILVDAVSRGEAPGTVSVIEPDLASGAGPGAMDAHSMSPDTVFALMTSLGVTLGSCCWSAGNPLTSASGWASASRSPRPWTLPSPPCSTSPRP